MRHLSLAFIAVLLATAVRSQECDISVPANAYVVITSDAIVDVSDTVVWICADVTGLTLTGNNNTYIMAGFGSVGLQGTNNTAYIRNGNYWSVSGNDNTVYEGYGADAQIGEGSNSSLIECPTMIIDFSNAPSPGCSAVGIDGPDHQVALSAVLRDPVLEITNTGTEVPYRITDALGRTVTEGHSRSGTTSVQLQALPAGVYTLADTERNALVLRFMKP